MLPFQRAKKLRLLDVSCRGWLPIGFRQVNNVKVSRRLLYQCRSTIVSIIIPGSLTSFPSPLRTFHRKVFSTLNVSVRFSKFAKARPLGRIGLSLSVQTFAFTVLVVVVVVVGYIAGLGIHPSNWSPRYNRKIAEGPSRIGRTRTHSFVQTVD